MTRQPDLFRRMCAELHARQAELFQAAGRESCLRCLKCGEYLVETPSGYVACPNGHGKLRVDERPGA